ncbi:MAG: ornithine cyclodeaminase family protein [Actinomycetota bacterium]
MLILTRNDVEVLLDPGMLVDALGRAMADLSAGRASMPARIAARVSDHDGGLFAMPAFVPSLEVLESKLVSLFPHNRDTPTHQAVILCFDPDNGTPSVLMDATYITETRTAAGSALATRLLARDDASVLAVIGTGVQARSHARLVVSERPFEKILIAGRDPERAAHVAAELTEEMGRDVESVPDVESGVERAQVVCAATHSPEPVVRRDWIQPGTHINSVGYNTAGREIDAATVANALVVVESRAAALAPPPSGSNDLLWPIRDGAIDESHVHAEIGELVAGSATGRTTPDQITLYKSVGVGVQDAAAAALVIEAARQQGAGTSFVL